MAWLLKRRPAVPLPNTLGRNENKGVCLSFLPGFAGEGDREPTRSVTQLRMARGGGVSCLLPPNVNVTIYVTGTRRQRTFHDI